MFLKLIIFKIYYSSIKLAEYIYIYTHQQGEFEK